MASFIVKNSKGRKENITIVPKYANFVISPNVKNIKLNSEKNKYPHIGTILNIINKFSVINSKY